MLTRRRLRAHSGLISSIAAVIVLISAVLGGMLASVSGASIAAARQSLADAPAADGAIRISIRVASGPAQSAEQDATVHDVVTGALGGRAAAVVIERDVVVPELTAATPDGSRTVAIVADPGIVDDGALAAGDWPAETAAGSPAQIAVPTEVAESLGLAVGDALTLPGNDDASVPFVVSGVIDELPGDGPFPLVAEGDAPLVVRESAFAGLDTRPIARWTVSPDLGRITTADVDRLAEGLPGLRAAIDDAPGARSQGVVIEGGLGGTVTGIRAEARVAGAIVPVALLLVAGAGVLAALELARSLAAARADEVSLLRSRGASPRQLIRAAAIDWMLISVPSAVAGATAGVVLAPVLSGRPSTPTPADLALIAVIAGAVAVTVALAGTIVAARAALAPLRRESLGVEQRERRALDAGALLLVVVLAAIALVAFRLAGGPVRVDARGGIVVDPVAVLAPALVLFAAALLGGAALRPLLALLARSTQGRRGAGAAIAATQLARRATAFAVPSLLIATAVGGGIVAATYDATAASAREGARALELGGGVRVSAIDASASAAVLASLREVGRASGRDDAVAGAPVVTTTLSIAEGEVDLVAIDAASIEEVVAVAGSTVDRAALRDHLAADPVPAIGLPPAAIGLRVAVRAVPAVPVETAVWLMDAQGAVVRVAAQAADEGADPGAVVATLPSGAVGGAAGADAGWRLVAIDVRPMPAALPDDGVMEIAVGDLVAITEVGEEPLRMETPWVPQPEATRRFPGTIAPVMPGDDAAAVGSALGVTISAVRIEATRLPEQPVRLMAGPGIPAMVLTTALAERTSLRLGDELRAATASVGRPVVGRVAGTATVILGSSAEEAIAVDLAAFTHHQLATTSTPLSPDQYWLAAGLGERVGGVIAEVERAAPDAVVEAVAAPPDALLLDAVRGALWAAAGSVALLALASVLAAAAASRRQRATEVVVLRALGRRGALQARDRAGELAVLLLASSAIGAVAGGLVAATTVRDLARAIVLDAPAALRLDLALPVGGAAVGAVALVVLLGGIAALHGAAVARQAQRLSAAEVLR